jgi:tRNA(His) 5'-end guanylyltransferase
MAGFTQSDEISLIWNKPDWFSGKAIKVSSVLAGMTSSRFMYELHRSEDYHQRVQPLFEQIPHFDARVFTVPSMEELANAMLWRVLDCEKNSVSMLAHSHFSHKSLQGKNSIEMKQQLVEIEDPIDQYPKAFVHGTWVQRRIRQRKLSLEELEKIPEPHRPNIDELVTRHDTLHGSYPAFKSLSIDQKIDWLCTGSDLKKGFGCREFE